MPEQTIIKLKIRRGTDSQRRAVILEQGELGYTTDTARVFIGDGTTSGGRPVGSVIHPPLANTLGRLSITRAVQNDIVVEKSLMYQLTGTDYSNSSHWVNISPKVDGSVLRYTAGTNILSIPDAAIGNTKLNPSIVMSNGGLSFGTGLSANVDNVTIGINSTTNKLFVKGITENSISNTAFGNSISGGNGNKINVNFDPDYLGYNFDSRLTITKVPPNTVNTSSLSSNFVGAGLEVVGGSLRAILKNVDNDSLESNAGVISLKAKHAGNVSTRFDNINYNVDGVITSRTSMFGYLLSGSTGGTGSAYNGVLNQDTFTNQQTFTARYTDITLASSYIAGVSSAGFIVLNTSAGGDIAIPIFKFTQVLSSAPPIS
jgi:hypothetical protein